MVFAIITIVCAYPLLSNKCLPKHATEASCSYISWESVDRYILVIVAVVAEDGIVNQPPASNSVVAFRGSKDPAREFIIPRANFFRQILAFPDDRVDDN